VPEAEDHATSAVAESLLAAGVVGPTDDNQADGNHAADDQADDDPGGPR
jgi:hypothetical protein